MRCNWTAVLPANLPFWARAKSGSLNTNEQSTKVSQYLLSRVEKTNIISLTFSATTPLRGSPRNTKLSLYDVESNTPNIESADVHSAIPQNLHARALMARWVCIRPWPAPCVPRVQSFPNAQVPLVPLRETLNTPVPNVHAEDFYIFQSRLSSRKPSRVAALFDIKRRVETKM